MIALLSISPDSPIVDEVRHLLSLIEEELANTIGSSTETAKHYLQATKDLLNYHNVPCFLELEYIMSKWLIINSTPNLQPNWITFYHCGRSPLNNEFCKLISNDENPYDEYSWGMPTKQAPNLLIPPHLVEHLSFVAHDKRYEAMKIVFPDAYALIDKIDELIQFVEKQIDRKQPVLAIKE